MTLPVVELGLNRPLDIEITKVTQPFWAGLTEGLFKVVKCSDCGRLSFPPRAICPQCHCRACQWVSVSGWGTLYSITKVHNSPAIYGILSPMRVAIIDLEEGLRVVTRMLPDGREPPLDSPVQMVITQHPDGFHYAARPLVFAG